MSKTIGVIGLGSIGMRHAKNLADLGHTVYAYDPDESRAMEFMKSWPTGAPNPRGTSRHIEEIFETSEAIVIASPTELHFKHILAAAGKHTLVEKPIVSKVSHYNLLQPVTPECHIDKLMVGYNLRFHSCVKKAREWLGAGLIGKPIWANFTLGQYNDRPPYLRDGVILNWSHEIDLCLYLLGGAGVSGSSTRLTDGKDDLTDILLTHESGCRSTVHLDYVSKPEIRRFIIVGDIGHLCVDLPARNAYTNDSEGTRQFHGTDTWDDNYIEEMQAFIDQIDGKETIGCSGEEGLEVLKICLEVRRQAGLT